MVVGHLLGVILFLLVFESSFLGERLLPLLVVGAFALVWYGGVTIVGLFYIGLLRAWFFWVRGFLCVFGGCGCECCFWFIPVGVGLSLFPSQRVMHSGVIS